MKTYKVFYLQIFSFWRVKLNRSVFVMILAFFSFSTRNTLDIFSLEILLLKDIKIKCVLDISLITDKRPGTTKPCILSISNRQVDG